MAVPPLPRELIDLIVAYLAGDTKTLLACAAASHTLNASSRSLLLARIVVDDSVPRKGFPDFHNFVPTFDDLSRCLRSLHLRGRGASTWRDISVLDIRIVASVLYHLERLQDLTIEHVRIVGSLQHVQSPSRKLLDSRPYRLQKLTFGALVVSDEQYKCFLLELLSMFSEVDHLVVDPDIRYAILAADYHPNDHPLLMRPVTNPSPPPPPPTFDYVPKLGTIVVKRYTGICSLKCIMDIIKKGGMHNSATQMPAIGFAKGCYPSAETEAQVFFPLLVSIASSLVHLEIDLGRIPYRNIEGTLFKLSWLQRVTIQTSVSSTNPAQPTRSPPPWARIFFVLNTLVNEARAPIEHLRIIVWVPDTGIDRLRMGDIQWARLTSVLEKLSHLKEHVTIVLQVAYEPFFVAGIPIAVDGSRTWEELWDKGNQAKAIVSDGLPVIPINWEVDYVSYSR